jgi:hypothetical protein
VSARVTPFAAYRGSVSEIRVRLAPIDVGFDLRGKNVPAEFPPDTTVASYATVDGKRCVVEGTPSEVVETLRAAGYLLELQS